MRIRKKKKQSEPSVEFVPVIHGEWLEALPPCDGFICSVCGSYKEPSCYEVYFDKKTKSRFCPNCGARIDLK